MYLCLLVVRVVVDVSVAFYDSWLIYDTAAAAAAPIAAEVATTEAVVTAVEVVAAVVVNVFDTPVDGLLVSVVVGCCDCPLMFLLLLF